MGRLAVQLALEVFVPLAITTDDAMMELKETEPANATQMLKEGFGKELHVVNVSLVTTG